MHGKLKTSLLLGFALVAAGAVSSCKSTSSTRNSRTGRASSNAQSSGRVSDSTVSPRGGAGSGSGSASSSSSGSGRSAAAGSGSGRSGGGSSASMRRGDMNVAKLAFPTGDERTSALLLEKLTPQQVVGGAPFTYMMEVTNVSNLPLDSVQVMETPPTNFKMTSSKPKSTMAGGGLVFNLGELSPGQTKTIEVMGSATGADGTIDSCTAVDYKSGVCSSIAVVKPAIKVNVTGPAEVTTCDDICYTYTVTNTGTGAASNVVVRGSLPNGVTADGKSTFSKNVGNLRGGESKDFQVCVEAAKGSFQMGGTASADGGLTSEANKVATAVKEPMLTLVKTSNPAKAFVGRKIRYNMVVTNTGDGVAKGVTLVDTLPANAEFSSASGGRTPSGGKVTWNLGDLQPGESKSVELAMKGTRLGTLTNSAECKGVCAPRVSHTATTSIGGIPAILLEVVDLEDPVEVGDNTTYVITVTNQGSADDTDVKIECTIPPNTTLVSSEGATASMGGGNVSGRTITFPPLARLAPKAEVAYRVTVKGNSPADARFRVKMGSDNLTAEDVEETEATNFYE